MLPMRFSQVGSRFWRRAASALIAIVAVPGRAGADDTLINRAPDIVGPVQVHFAFPDKLGKPQNDDFASIPTSLLNALPIATHIQNSPLLTAPLWQQFDKLWSSVSAQDCKSISSQIS